MTFLFIQIVLGLMMLLAAVVFFLLVLRLFQAFRDYPLNESPFHVDEVALVAHRGGSLEAPENTMPAFEHAVGLGEDVILEFDVQLTKDEQVVVIHDDTVDRTTNATGAVSSFTLEELKQLDAAHNYQDSKGEFPLRGKGVVVPTLDEVLAAFPRTRMILEMKGDDSKIAELSLQVVLKHETQMHTVFFSQNSEPVVKLRTLMPHWKYGATMDEVAKSVMHQRLFLGPVDPMLADVYSIPEDYQGHQILSKGLMSQIKMRNKKLYVWTVNEEQDMRRLIEAGVDGLVTDSPSLLRKVLEGV